MSSYRTACSIGTSEKLYQEVQSHVKFLFMSLSVNEFLYFSCPSKQSILNFLYFFPILRIQDVRVVFHIDPKHPFEMEKTFLFPKVFYENKLISIELLHS